MKKFTIYILLALSALSMTSCLEKYPNDAIPADEAINTVEDLNQAMIGVYGAFKSPSLYSGALTLLPDVQADFVYGVKGNSNVYGNIWRWDIQANNSDITNVYASLYGIIAQCNFLLDNVEKVKANTLTDKDLNQIETIVGEAHLARAIAYSDLIKMFCKAYDSDEQAEQDLGVVLVSHYETDEPMKRSSLKASYEFVLKDLEVAVKYLTIEDGFKGTVYNSIYFNEYVAHALRARIYLYMKKYDKAIESATKVIDSGYYKLSSSTEMINPEQSMYEYMWATDNSTEIIWKIGFTLNSYGGALGSIFFNYDNISVKPDYVPAQWVLAEYVPADLRMKAFFDTQITTGYPHQLRWYLLKKYWGNSMFEQVNVFHVCEPKVFRLSETYLIRAEAYAMTGDYSRAGKDISSIRNARYSTYGGSASMNEKNAMEIIESERVKELYMEGFRLQDLKRWHKGFERRPQDQSIEHGSSLKIAADNPFFVWPIPRHELESPGSQIEGNESNK